MKIRIKEGAFSAEGMDNSYEFIKDCYDSFLETSKLLFFTKKVFPEVRVPFHNTYSHLKEDISQISATLFGYAHPGSVLTRLFYNWICACILYNRLSIWKYFYVSYFSQKQSCKLLRDAFYGRNQFQLIIICFLYFIHKHLFKFFYSWLQEEEFFYVKDKRLCIVGIFNANRSFCSTDEFIWSKGNFSASYYRVIDYFSYLIWFSLTKSLSTWVFKENMKEGVGVNIKGFFSLREKDTETVFNLSFGFSEFFFKFLDKSCKTSKIRLIRRGCKELRVRDGKEGDNFSIFFVTLRGVVCRDELKESVSYFRIEDKSLDTVTKKEAVKREMISPRGFHHNSRIRQSVQNTEKLRESIRGHRKLSRVNGFSFFVNGAEMKVILRNINTYIVLHVATSLKGIEKLSLTASSPVAGAFVAQPTYWKLRDRGTYSFGGSQAYKQWSPYPSLFYKTHISLRDILN